MKNYVVKTNVATDSPIPYLGTEFRQAVRKAVHKLKHRFNYRLKVYDIEAKKVYEYIIWYANNKWIADKKMMFSMPTEAKERKTLMESIRNIDINIKIPDSDWLHNYALDFNAEEKQIIKAKVIKNVRKEKED